MPTHLIETPDGTFRARFSLKGLAQLDFPDQVSSRDGSPDEIKPNDSVAEWAVLTSEAVRAVLTSRPIKELPPLDISSGTEFQQKVWRVILSIQKGETLSYGEIAEQIGAPRAVRAVGGACGANPIPLVIPCHRVLARGQRLGGFSGGLQWKTLLLGRENPDLFANLEEKSKLERTGASFQTRI
jgi:methylated-DNA-[protein]-cysteine S-methyltransferase